VQQKLLGVKTDYTIRGDLVLTVRAILPCLKKVRVIFGGPLDPRELERTGA
jgi:hypothetical protein